MSEQKDSKLELQSGSSKALVQRIDHKLELVERLLAEADAVQGLAFANFTNSLGMKMIWCPPGEFLMGSPEHEVGRSEYENQVHVRIARGFWLASTPVTQSQWQILMQCNRSAFQDSEDLPIDTVNWRDVQEFCDKLNRKENLPEGYHYALPTEAQWEYACRAGTTGPYHFGSKLNGTEANCNGDFPHGTDTLGPSLNRTCPVGRYEPNAWGLYDMHGNVWEWCSDWWCDQLPGGTDPVGPTTGTCRVLRGGSWFYDADFCRAASRNRILLKYREKDVGFRPALIPGSWAYQSSPKANRAKVNRKQIKSSGETH